MVAASAKAETATLAAIAENTAVRLASPLLVTSSMTIAQVATKFDTLNVAKYAVLHPRGTLQMGSLSCSGSFIVATL